MPLYRRLPKRGFNNIFGSEYTEVRLDAIARHFGAGDVVDAEALKARFNIPLTPFSDALAQTNEVYKVMRDPEAREKRMVHPQFYATVYEPGESDWHALPDGPAPARD